MSHHIDRVQTQDLKVELIRRWDIPCYRFLISGETPELEKFVERYFKRYHPAGYGTMATWTTDRKEVMLSRSVSCD